MKINAYKKATETAIVILIFSKDFDYSIGIINLYMRSLANAAFIKIVTSMKNMFMKRPVKSNIWTALSFFSYSVICLSQIAVLMRSCGRLLWHMVWLISRLLKYAAWKKQNIIITPCESIDLIFLLHKIDNPKVTLTT